MIDDHYRHSITKYTTEELIEELSKRDIPIPTSPQLIGMAQTDFHNREGRIGLHDKASWMSGWMAGFLTPGKPNWEKKK